VVGFSIYGAFSFGGTEFFRRAIAAAAGPQVHKIPKPRIPTLKPQTPNPNTYNPTANRQPPTANRQPQNPNSKPETPMAEPCDVQGGLLYQIPILISDTDPDVYQIPILISDTDPDVQGGLLYQIPILMLGSALASVVAIVFTCPFMAVRNT
jgi:hypothetical protein